jgi:hypothetical protein
VAVQEAAAPAPDGSLEVVTAGGMTFRIVGWDRVLLSPEHCMSS